MDEILAVALPIGITVLVGALGAIAVTLLSGAVIKMASRRPRIQQVLRRQLRWPGATFAFTVAATIAGTASGAISLAGDLGPGIRQTLIICCIAAGAWLLTRIIAVIGDSLASEFTTTTSSGQTRRIRTQVILLRRVAIAVVVIIAIGAALFTFPGARAIGTSLLASAGLASVIAGLAAQSVLGNVFAGMQLAFSDAIRVDDVVVVEEEWGTIEEITLTYVVVRIWDDRRLVLPSTYFTQTPFTNWSRRTPMILGTVEFDLDWGVDIDRMRDELDRILAASKLWDGRSQGLNITEATGGCLRVRVVLSTDSTDKVFDLRCEVREALTKWLQTEHADALPVNRLTFADADPLRVRTSERTDVSVG